MVYALMQVKAYCLCCVMIPFIWLLFCLNSSRQLKGRNTVMNLGKITRIFKYSNNRIPIPTSVALPVLPWLLHYGIISALLDAVAWLPFRSPFHQLF